MAQGDFKSFSAAEESTQSPFEKKPKSEEEKPTVDVQKLVEKTEGNDDEDSDYYADKDDDDEDGEDDSEQQEEEEEEGSESDRVESEDEDGEGEGEGEEGEGEEEEEELSSDTAAEMLKKEIGDSNRDFMPSDGEKVDHKTWIRYWRQIQSSEGFDIDDFPGVCNMTGIVPIRDFRGGGLLYPELVELATMAIQGHNDSKGTKYQFKEILSVNSQVVSGWIYYITFEVTNDAHEVKNDDADEVRSDDGEDAVEIFQAKVYAGIVETKVKICRPKSFANRAI